MQVYILDEAYDILGYIDAAESILWRKKYNDIGECEIYIPCDGEYLSLLRRGHYVYRYDDDMFCKIQRVEITTDAENGDYIVATGTDICTILAGRVVRWQIVYSGTLGGFIEKVLNDNVVKAAEPRRRIANFKIDTSNFSEFRTPFERSAFTEDLLQLIMTTCKTHSIGFRVSYDIEARLLVFRLYRGKNKAVATGDEYIEFSPQFANILSSNYVEDESGYKNVAYVGYKSADEADEQTYLLSVYKGQGSGAAEPLGEARREVYIDGTGTSRSITHEELLVMFPETAISSNKVSAVITEGSKKVTSSTYYATINGARTAVATSLQDVAEAGAEEAEEKITVTDATYLMLIRALGNETLAESNETQEFNGAVDTIDTYEYKTDYDLGDIVRVINDYGIEAEARITELLESDDDDDGYNVEPKFEYIN